MPTLVDQKGVRMGKRFLYLIFCIGLLTGCSEEASKEAPEVVNLEEKEEATPQVDLAYLNEYLFEKLDGVTLIRDYGEDTGHTDMQFGPDGSFTGSYLGKIANDGFDAGLSEYAWNWYHGEEIHTSKFEGKFKIVEQMNDYVYKMKLDDFKLTSEYGRYDDIYFNVDFALGIKPDADYYLYIPGTPHENAPGEDSRLDQMWSVDGGYGKTHGFVIWNKYEDEVFNERY